MCSGPSLQVGVGAFLTNDKQQVLLVQEASGVTKGKVSSSLQKSLPTQESAKGNLSS